MLVTEGMNAHHARHSGYVLMEAAMRDPRDDIVMVDGKPMRRGDTPAYKRIWEEEVIGSETEGPDGTISRNGKVVKAGPRADAERRVTEIEAAQDAAQTRVAPRVGRVRC